MSSSFVSFDVSGAIKTEALGLNENGRAAGFFVDANGVRHGFIDNGGVITTFDAAGSNTAAHSETVNGQTVIVVDGNTTATGISNSGQIVGFFYNATDHAQGFIDTKGSFVTVTVPGALDTFPQDITENGRIVGYFDDSTGTHGFVDNKGAFTTINDPAATNGTFATGINDPGQVVGYFLDANKHAHGFIAGGSSGDGNDDNQGGNSKKAGATSFTTIDSTTVSGLSGATDVFVEGVGENGRIVGYYLDAANHAHGFVDVKGAITKIDSTTIAGLSSATDVFAQGINDEGQITGYYVNATGTHGFVTNPGIGDRNIAVMDTDDNEDMGGAEDAYSGPVARLQHQFIFAGTVSVNISVSDDNWFLHGGPGQDALATHGGYNVLDGGTGSNFLTGGSGTDTFFVDDRGPSGDIWSTMNGFHKGDDATVFGLVPAADNANVQWFDNQGAAGFTGLTLHVVTPNGPTASLTLPGYSTSDLGNGRLAIQFGNEPDTTPFMHIIASS
jgi:hypothetical protein